MAEQQHQRFIAEDFFPHVGAVIGARDTLTGMRTWGWATIANRDNRVAQMNANPAEAANTAWKNDDNDDWMRPDQTQRRLAAVPDPDFVANLDNTLGDEYRPLYDEFQPTGPFPSSRFQDVRRDDHESPATRHAFADWLRRRIDHSSPTPPSAAQPAWQRLGFVSEEAYNSLSTVAAEHADRAGHCGTYDRLAEEVGLLTREQTRHLQDRTWIITARIAATVTVPRDAIDREKVTEARRALIRAVRDLPDDTVLLMISTTD